MNFTSSPARDQHTQQRCHGLDRGGKKPGPPITIQGIKSSRKTTTSDRAQTPPIAICYLCRLINRRKKEIYPLMILFVLPLVCTRPCRATSSKSALYTLAGMKGTKIMKSKEEKIMNQPRPQ